MRVITVLCLLVLSQYTPVGQNVLNVVNSTTETGFAQTDLAYVPANMWRLCKQNAS
jgi:hypothetical protein